MTVLVSAVVIMMLTLVAGCASQPEQQAFSHLRAVERSPVVVDAKPYSRDDLPVLDGDASLPDFLAYAALNNPGLEAAFNRWKVAVEKAPQVRTLPDPRFNYGYFIREVETRVGPQEHRVGLSQMFPWFGKLRLRGEAALEAAEAARQHYEGIKLKLFYEVQRAYFEYYYLGRAIEVTRENIDLLQQFEEVARAQYEAGEALYADVIKAQTELDKLHDRLRTLHEFEGPALSDLNAALNRPFNAALPWPESIPLIHLHLDDDQLVEALVESSPELKRLGAVIAREQTHTELARKEFFPDITFGVDYVETGNALSSGTPDDGKDPVIVGFSINLPIWQGKLRAGVREAEARHEAAIEEQLNQENRLTTRLKRALFGYQDASRKIALYRDALIPKAEQTLKVSRRAFEAGKVDFLSLIDAERVLLEFQLTFERSLADHAQRYAEMEMLLGRSLTELVAEAEEDVEP